MGRITASIAFIAFVAGAILSLSAAEPAPDENLRLIVGGEEGLSLLDTKGLVREILPGSPPGAMEPCWSPDGKQIAFVTLETGNSQIYSLDLATAKVRRLTRTATDDRMPSWSPDSKRIVFMSGSEGEICTMNADGSNLVTVTDNPLYDADPFWSPHGEKIAFVSLRDGNESLRLYTMNADGSNVRPVIDADLPGWVFPGWSPDGAQIAFGRRTPDGNVHLSIVSAKSPMGWTVIADVPGLNSFPAWSPDGRYIAFVRLPTLDYPRAGYGGEILLYDVKEKKERVIATGRFPLWNPRPHWKPLAARSDQ